MQKDFLEEIRFDEKGLVPVIAQDYETNEVLMLAYMNKESLMLTLETGKAHYFSRSRSKLWLKGETSGNYQHIKGLRYDCDKDSILILVHQIGGACHDGYHSCFYTDESGIISNKDFDPTEQYTASILYEVYNVIQDRKLNPKDGSYTNYLFEKGLDKMLKKVGEESAEVIIAAKNKNNEEMIYEMSDLLYHLMVVMSNAEITWKDLFNELSSRKFKD